MGGMQDSGSRSRAGSARSAVPPAPAFSYRLLVPGLTQLAWHQHQRGLVYLGSCATALGAALFCWGTPLGWFFLLFCYLSHVVALCDVVRQRAYPVFPRRHAVAATILAIGLIVYLPLTVVLESCALVAGPDSGTGSGYLVNRLAYTKADPVPGQSIWLRRFPDVGRKSGPGGRRRRAGGGVDGTPLDRGRSERGVCSPGIAAALPDFLAVSRTGAPRSHRPRVRRLELIFSRAHGHRQHGPDRRTRLGPLLPVLGTAPALMSLAARTPCPGPPDSHLRIRHHACADRHQRPGDSGHTENDSREPNSIW